MVNATSHASTTSAPVIRLEHLGVDFERLEEVLIVPLPQSDSAP